MTEKYHHGHLREELISEAMLSVRTGNIDQFSLRATARKLGVSPAAVYHHFSDKVALVNAVIRETGILLNERMHHALVPPPIKGEHAYVLGLAYINFAIEEPALFSQLTSTACSEAEDIQEMSLKMVADAIVADAENTVFTKQELLEKVWSAWAISHGFAALTLAGRISPDEARKVFRNQCHISD